MLLKSIISEANLARVEAGDIETLLRFDDHGIILGPDESTADLTARIRALHGHLQAFRHQLGKQKAVQFLDIALHGRDKIPADVFLAAGDQTRVLYDFAIDWVPGFYTNYRMGLLFAGCAFFSVEDFFAVFIIRKAFQKRARWWIYGRDELLAHELCHIAHCAHYSPEYEELFAYQTSPSLFRRVIGGLLRTTTDTYLMLGATLLLLVAQIVNVFLGPPDYWPRVVMPVVAGLLVAVIGLISARYRRVWRIFSGARRNLAGLAGDHAAMGVLFRCSAEEIGVIARLRAPGALRQWLREAASGQLRWRVIDRKFGLGCGQTERADAPTETSAGATPS